MGSSSLNAGLSLNYASNICFSMRDVAGNDVIASAILGSDLPALFCIL